jgi:tetratricopeptide (TPR) repeat protein
MFRGICPMLCAAGLILNALLAHALPNEPPVRLWEESLVIPTYLVGEPDRNPIFYSGRAYQGAKGPVYPYPMLDKLTDIRQDKAYRAVYLENQYVKICVLPELGGRIFSAQDKTNGYDFFYRQHVIKPALIGMLGAWISGGVEWNIPHHHRATTFMPVDYTISENPDGSKTIWIGELELRHRMKWILGLTLHPDRSYIEAEVKLFNRTPLVHSFLYFANVAVHANEDYQVVFPPGTEYATYHGKTHFSRWPISTEVFNGVDYTRGVDVSWWKNHPSPTSFFAWNHEDDFFGGYDHGKKAGVVHVADHHIVPGKKFWAFANGDEGRMWDKILTETDGPYIELMAGAYSDNQPDYSWIQPYEVKTWKQYWYPLREIGAFKYANLNAAVNLEVDTARTAKVAINTTADYAGARITLRAGRRTVFEKPVDIGPAKPWAASVPLPEGVTDTDLSLSLIDSAGRELIAYRPQTPRGEPMPDSVKPPPAPQDVGTVEELYLTGLRLDQFYNPVLEPEPYFEEALKRDPGNARVSTALGILYLRRGLWSEAEKKFRTAVQRLTRDYTRPKDGEALYYLGVALDAQGKQEEGYRWYADATWSEAWSAAAYYALAELDVRKGDNSGALDHLGRSLAANGRNTRALALKALVLRKMGRLDEAEQSAALALAIDPLDFWAGNERYLARSAIGSGEAAKGLLADLAHRMRGEPQNYLETALDYSRCGLWDEAIEVLARLDDSDNAKKLSPMVYYFLGYFNERKGNPEAASKYFRLGSKASPDYCFPFRWEAQPVLESALRANPRDARACYYLGNLFCDHQPENAIRAWEASREWDGSFATVHRNLGLAYARVEGNLTKGIASLERALGIDPADARVLLELDVLSEQAGVPAEKRLARLESHQKTVLERDDTLQQQLVLYVQTGQYDKTIDVLSRRHFHAWEGGGDIHDVYINAHLLRGQQHLKNQRAREALKDFEAALEYPENLEVGRPLKASRDAEIYYHIACAQEALGNASQARISLQKSVAQEPDMTEVRYFQALAHRKLGQEAQATAIFSALLAAGERGLQAASNFDYFAKFGEKRSAAVRLAHARYLMGLGHLGQGRRTEAKAAFEEVLRKDPNHLGAITQLAALPSRS